MFQQPIAILEQVRFRLVPEADPVTFDAVSAAADGFLQRQPGYAGRLVVREEDGTFVDLVGWTDRESAEAAATAFLGDPAGAGLVAVIDPASMEFQHLEVVRHTGG